MYNEDIDRAKPTCFIFLVDQSGSMSDLFGGQIEGVTNPTKARGAADAVNRILKEMVIKCAKDEGVRDYIHVGIWGYGAGTGPVFRDGQGGLLPISQVDARARIETRKKQVPDGVGGLVETDVNLQVWLDPVSSGATPMCAAFRDVRDAVAAWMPAYSQSYPPTIINITDGASTDGDAAPIAGEITSKLNVNGSAAMVFNIHLSDQPLPPVLFPGADSGLADSYARQLFGMSSVLPEKLLNEAKAQGMPVTNGSRGFVFNSDIASLIKFLDIGTKTIADIAPGR